MDVLRLPLPVSDLRRDKLGEKWGELPGCHAGGRMVPGNADVASQEKQLRQEIGAARTTSDYLRGRDAANCRRRRQVESVDGCSAGVRRLQRGDITTRGWSEQDGARRGTTTRSGRA